MALFTIVKLIEGKNDVAQYYKNAKQIWNEIRTSKEFKSAALLSRKMEIMQTSFELQCGGKYLGQEIMAMVGIGQFYSDLIGFDDPQSYEDALKVKTAAMQSKCSVEVLDYFEKAADSFGLIRERDMRRFITTDEDMPGTVVIKKNKGRRGIS